MIIGMIRYAIISDFNNYNNKSVNQLYEEPYFSDRFKLFYNITLPSFANQTNKDFILLVYNSNSIPKDKKELFDNIEKEYPFVKNIYLNNGSMFIPDEFKEKNMLTFRIDNDDGISLDFIEKLQKIKKNYKENIAISIPQAYKLCRTGKNEYKILSFYYISNSMGLGYLSNDGKTIMGLGNHTKVIENNNSILLEGNGGLQILNGYNVSNNYKKREGKKYSKELVYTYDEMKKYLVKENYADMDISCIPIIKD